MDRKSFILHIDSLCVLNDLSDEQKGQLFYAIYQYQLGNEIELSPIIKIAFSQFKNQFLRDEEKYKKTVEARRQAGSKGGKQRVSNQANALSAKQNQANQADSDSVSDSVSKKEKNNNVVIQENDTMLEAREISLYLHEKIKTEKENFNGNPKSWEKDIEKAIRIDGRSLNHLKRCIDWIYSDKGSFWKPNILSGKKLREKYDQMELQAKRDEKKDKKQQYGTDEIYNTGYTASELIDIAIAKTRSQNEY